MSNAGLWLSHAEELLRARHLLAAIASYRIAERKGADPDRCAAGRWMAFMLLGRFEQAWQERDAIRARGAPDPHRCWNGESLRGKRVIVRCLRGPGDAIQFLRFIPALRSIATRVIVEVPPGMLDLVGFIEGVDEAIAWGDHPTLSSQWDVQVEVTELPYIFRTRIHHLPIAVNYLRDPGTVQRLHRLNTGSERLEVGVVWSAGEWNSSRSIPLPLLKPLLQMPGIDFWNLQGGAARREWRSLAATLPLNDCPAACADAELVPMAAFIGQLDLVITVDTPAAHLAGAMGCPAWILLPYEADWRWLHGRDDSPWYPSLSLFRQLRRDDWSGAVRNLRGALAELLDRRVARKAAA